MDPGLSSPLGGTAFFLDAAGRKSAAKEQTLPPRFGAPYKWEGLGLKSPASGLSEQEVDNYAKLFWLGMRRIFSALTPSIPIYLCQGNHDGESGYDPAKNQARK